MFGVQESLFSTTPTSSGEPTADREFTTLSRRALSDEAWIDHAPGWLAGDACLFDDLAELVEWAQPEVEMYDRTVLTPRLVAKIDPGLHPALGSAVEILSDRYGRSLNRISANWYRNGHDSVAWHGDRIARERDEATVATISLRGPREFRFKPAVGGVTQRLLLGHGDLVVMGGSFQRTWRHAVPKSAGLVPPRMVVMFRHSYD